MYACLKNYEMVCMDWDFWIKQPSRWLNSLELWKYCCEMSKMSSLELKNELFWTSSHWKLLFFFLETYRFPSTLACIRLAARQIQESSIKTLLKSQNFFRQIIMQDSPSCKSSKPLSTPPFNVSSSDHPSPELKV